MNPGNPSSAWKHQPNDIPCSIYIIGSIVELLSFQVTLMLKRDLSISNQPMRLSFASWGSREHVVVHFYVSAVNLSEICYALLQTTTVLQWIVSSCVYCVLSHWNRITATLIRLSVWMRHLKSGFTSSTLLPVSFYGQAEIWTLVPCILVESSRYSMWCSG